MALWLPRNLTPYVKITLMLSKITHILLSLPIPKLSSIKIIKKGSKVFYKPPKFKQNVKELGGLHLTNILLFDKALMKLSWPRRICNQTEGWASFPRYYSIDKAIFYGSIYIKNIEKIY